MNTITKSAVRNFMDSHPIKPRKSVLDSMEYKRALEAILSESVAHQRTSAINSVRLSTPFSESPSSGFQRSLPLPALI